MSTYYRLGCYDCWRAALDEDEAARASDDRWCCGMGNQADPHPNVVHELIELRAHVLLVDRLVTFGRDRGGELILGRASYFGRLASGWSASAGRHGVVSWEVSDWWESTCEFLREHAAHRLCCVSEYGEVELDRPTEGQ